MSIRFIARALAGGALVCSFASAAAVAASPRHVRPFVAPNVRRVCPEARAGAQCGVLLRTDVQGRFATIYGYGPSDLQSAYLLPVLFDGLGQTIGVVVAYDDPAAESDLGVYRAHYALPACTTANGCFKKLNQFGVQGNYPGGNQNWALEGGVGEQMVP